MPAPVNAVEPVASAPASVPAEPSPSELSRLVLNVVGQSDPQARLEAAVAVLNSPSDEGVKALCDVLEIKNNEAAKLAVCQAVSQVKSTRAEFIPGLMALLDNKESTLSEAAAAALAGYSDPMVIARLKEQEHQILGKRFVATCKQLYALLATDADRAAYLQRWLKSTLPLERVAALEIIHEKMSAGARPAPEVLQQIRQMLSDRDERVRQRLIVIFRDLRQPEDAPRVQAMLAGERSSAVREEIYRALGYLGEPAIIPACIAGLNEPDASVAAQAADALGRLVARWPGNPSPDMAAAVSALVQRAGQPIDDRVLREQVIEAMARIADPAFLPVLRNHAGANEKVPAIRQAALRGIGQIGEAADVELVIDRAVNDPDPGVREFAAEALGKLGSRPEHLDLLRGRLDPKVEPAAGARARAWESYRLLFVKVLSPSECDTTLESWAQSDPVTVGRRIELLADLEKRLSGANAEPQQLTRVREWLGDAYMLGGRVVDAAQAFARTLEAVGSSEPEVFRRLAGKLLDAHLRSSTPEKAVVLLMDAKMQPIRDPLIARLLDYIRREGAANRAAAIGLLDKINQMVPDRFGAEWARQFDEVRAGLPPATQPAATAPAS